MKIFLRHKAKKRAYPRKRRHNGHPKHDIVIHPISVHVNALGLCSAA